MRRSPPLANVAAVALAGVLAFVTWASAAGPIAPEIPAPIYSRQLVFSIPFKIEQPSPGSPQPRGVQLHVSEDRGKSWQMVEQAAASAERFGFRAPRDGEYWFFVRTLDANGQLQPIAPPAPELCVIVDTLAPRLKLQNQIGEGGEITAAWQILDQALKPDSFHLEFQLADDSAWQTVNTPRDYRPDQHVVDGRVTWWPGTSTGKARIRASVADLAGNPAVSQVEVDLDRRQALPIDVATRPRQLASNRRPSGSDPPLGPTASNQGSATRPPSNPHSQQWKPDHSAREPFRPDSLDTATGRPSADSIVSSGGAPAGEVVEEVAPPPATESIAPGIPVDQHIVDGRTNPARPQRRVGRPVSVDGSPEEEPFDAELSGAGNNVWPPPETLPPGGAPPTNSRDDSGSVEPATQFGDVQLPEGAAAKFVNALRFELEYDVESVGPAGIGRVELWGTRDGGKSWETFGIDPDNRSPFVVTVENEGLYGFAIVVESGTGLGGLPPKSGDTAEVWVGVDLTKPAVTLVGIEQGAGDKAGEITVRWEASDALLGPRPVSLAFRDAAGGQWATFASGLQNSGQHQWQIDRRVPEQIYLRVEVRDSAGNVAVADSFEPISLDRVRPQGRIRDVRPARESTDGARIERTIWR